MHKAIHYLAYAFVAALPWQTVYLLHEIFIEGEKWHYGTIGIYASDMIAIAIIGLTGWKYRTEVMVWMVKQVQKPTVTTVLCGALCAYIFAGVYWSSDPILTMTYALRICGGIFLAASLRVIHPKIGRLGVILAGSAALSGLLAIGQFVYQEDFASTMLGLSKHSAHVGGVSVIEADGERWLRAYGSFVHPNMLGAMMAMLIVFVSGALLVRRQSRVRRAISLIMIAICFTALLASFSRGGMIGLLCGMLTLLILQNASGTKELSDKKNIKKGIAGITVVMFVIGAVFYTSYSNLWLARVQSDERLEKLSVQERTSQIGQALDIIKTKPILGVGAGTYTKYIALKDNEERGYNAPVWKYQPVHNTLILIMTEMGLVGIAVLAGLVVTIAIRVYTRLQGNSRREREIKVTIMAVLAVFIVTSLFEHWHWDNHMGILILALCAGLLLEKNNTRMPCDKGVEV